MSDLNILKQEERNEELDFKFREWERDIINQRRLIEEGQTDGKLADRIMNNIIWGDSHFNPNKK